MTSASITPRLPTTPRLPPTSSSSTGGGGIGVPLFTPSANQSAKRKHQWIHVPSPPRVGPTGTATSGTVANSVGGASHSPRGLFSSTQHYSSSAAEGSGMASPRGSRRDDTSPTAIIPSPLSSSTAAVGAAATASTTMTIGPPQCGVVDFFDWVSRLRYDPRSPSKQQLKEIRTAEQSQIASSRRRMSQTTSTRRLLALSSALRADLEVFINYLLDFGTKVDQVTAEDLDARDSMMAAESATSQFNFEAYIQLKTLFEILDVDRSGTLTFDELHRAAVIMERENYTEEEFQRLDKNRSGSIDFVEMLKAFFPMVPTRLLAKYHRDHAKSSENAISSVRERIGEKSFAEIEKQYRKFDSLPGGCNSENLTKHMSPFLKARPEIVEEVVRTFDEDLDGRLSFEEFTEMIKFSYPPYARAPDGAVGSDGKSSFSVRKVALWRETMAVRQMPELGVFDFFPPVVMTSGAEEAKKRANRDTRLAHLIGHARLKEARQRNGALAAMPT